jgi:hypothetical protein
MRTVPLRGPDDRHHLLASIKSDQERVQDL